MDLKLSKQDHARIYRVYEDLMGVNLAFDNDWEKARNGDVDAIADFQRLEDGLMRSNLYDADELASLFDELANWEDQLKYLDIDLSNEFGGLEL